MDLMPLAVAIPDALPALCQHFHVQRLDIFGSATDGHFDPASSDLDFLVVFQDLSESAYTDAYFGLREALSTLFEREIDLVTAPALENPYLRRRIEAQRRRLYPPA